MTLAVSTTENQAGHALNALIGAMQAVQNGMTINDSIAWLDQASANL